MKEYIKELNDDPVWAAGILAGDVIDMIDKDLGPNDGSVEYFRQIMTVGLNAGCALIGIAVSKGTPEMDERQILRACEKVRYFAQLQRTLRAMENN
jgi:hypothetical protein